METGKLWELISFHPDTLYDIVIVWSPEGRPRYEVLREYR